MKEQHWLGPAAGPGALASRTASGEFGARAPVELRLWIRTLQARVRAAQRRGLTGEEEQALAQLTAALAGLLDEASDTAE